MNFFQAQERARVASRWLVVWFMLAVTGVLGSLYALAVIAKSWITTGEYLADGPQAANQWLDATLASSIAPLAGGVIVIGSLYKLARLSAGGAVVARDLGGRQVDPSTTDLLERRLLNVVEEMAIASGLPAPEVWVMEGESGINAFAAGTDPSNAVVGVTRGCLERLNRDELQGVVAHEFSHILNGDMKLNMRLTGWVFGLVMIAMIGRMLLEVLRHVRISSDKDSKGNGVILVIAIIGAAVWAIGSIGTLFARLMQAAISRQREYLADASAVQFTRNPPGIAGALKKIGGFSRRGILSSPGAAEARHMFFATSDLLKFGLATHPPLENRIRALEPQWDGKFLDATRQAPPPRDQQAAVSSFIGGSASNSHSVPRDVTAEPKPPNLQAAAAIRSRLQHASARFRSKDEAKVLLYGLLLAQNVTDHDRAISLVRESADEENASAVIDWHRRTAGLSFAERIALVNLSLPWLRRMSQHEAREFLRLCRELIELDGSMGLFEFMLGRVLDRHVAVALGLRPAARMKFRSLAELGREAAILLGAFAGQSGDSAALDVAAAEFHQHTGMQLERIDPALCTLDDVSTALGRFEASTPLVKIRILRLCGSAAMSDGVLRDEEAQLLRAAADAIGAPLPPMVAQQFAG